MHTRGYEVQGGPDRQGQLRQGEESGSFLDTTLSKARAEAEMLHLSVVDGDPAHTDSPTYTRTRPAKLEASFEQIYEFYKTFAQTEADHDRDPGGFAVAAFINGLVQCPLVTTWLATRPRGRPDVPRLELQVLLQHRQGGRLVEGHTKALTLF